MDIVLAFILAVICILQNFIFPNMGPKKVNAMDTTGKKKRMMCIELEIEIIKKHDELCL